MLGVLGRTSPREDLRRSREDTPEKPRKDKSPEELPVADTTTRNGMVIVVCRVRGAGGIPQNVPRHAVLEVFLRVVAELVGLA